MEAPPRGRQHPHVRTFKNALGAETPSRGPTLPEARMHSPNENFPLESYLAGAQLNQSLRGELAAMA